MSDRRDVHPNHAGLARALFRAHLGGVTRLPSAIILVAALVALSGCKKKEPTPRPAAPKAAATTPAAETPAPKLVEVVKPVEPPGPPPVDQSPPAPPAPERKLAPDLAQPGPMRDGGMSVKKLRFRPDHLITVAFDEPVRSVPGDQAWLTVVWPGADEAAYGEYVYLTHNATSAQIAAPKVNGLYELRLHTNYGIKPHNRVARLVIEIDGGLMGVDRATFTLDVSEGRAGEVRPKAEFNQAIVPVAGMPASIAIVPLTAPDKAVATTIPHAALRVKLRTPVVAGPSEVRLSFGGIVRHRVPFLVKPGAPATPLHSQRFELSTTTLKVGERPSLTFKTPLQPAPGEQFWVTVVPKGAADTVWGAWQFVPHAATAMALEPLKSGGRFEIRLHSEYPTKATNVAARAAITVKGKRLTAGLGFELSRPEVLLGNAPVANYTGRVTAEMGLWITVVKKYEPDTSWGQWQFVPADTESTTLAAPQRPGAYEVRLHDGYPEKATNVIARQALIVLP